MIGCLAVSVAPLCFTTRSGRSVPLCQIKRTHCGLGVLPGPRWDQKTLQTAGEKPTRPQVCIITETTLQIPNNRKGGTASLRSRTRVKWNVVFGARFKGLLCIFYIKMGNWYVSKRAWVQVGYVSKPVPPCDGTPLMIILTNWAGPRRVWSEFCCWDWQVALKQFVQAVRLSTVDEESTRMTTRKRRAKTFRGAISHAPMYVDLHGSMLLGVIPDAVVFLANLIHLNLGGNEFRGGIPGAMIFLASLIVLKLDSNYLRGAIPDAVAPFAMLTHLSLDENELQGAIPEGLASLAHLIHLDLSYDELLGVIPDAVASLANLIVLDLDGNDLSGAIPDAIGAAVTHLDLRFNRLCGAIPVAVASLTNLMRLCLNLNNLLGAIPDAVGSLASLVELYLHSNKLLGAIPDAVASTSRLAVLGVGEQSSCVVLSLVQRLPGSSWKASSCITMSCVAIFPGQQHDSPSWVSLRCGTTRYLAVCLVQCHPWLSCSISCCISTTCLALFQIQCPFLSAPRSQRYSCECEFWRALKIR